MFATMKMEWALFLGHRVSALASVYYLNLSGLHIMLNGISLKIHQAKDQYNILSEGNQKNCALTHSLSMYMISCQRLWAMIMCTWVVRNISLTMMNIHHSMQQEMT